MVPFEFKRNLKSLEYETMPKYNVFNYPFGHICQMTNQKVYLCHLDEVKRHQVLF